MEISLAQTYFVSQTRKLEIKEQEIENEKRLEARKKLKRSEEQIEETIYNRGIKLPFEVATFKNKWIQALYNCSVKHLKQKRNIPEKLKKQEDLKLVEKRKEKLVLKNNKKLKS